MWIESINYIDSNENGVLDEGEEYGAGPDYINGEKASPEEVEAVYAACDMGGLPVYKGQDDSGGCAKGVEIILT